MLKSILSIILVAVVFVAYSQDQGTVVKGRLDLREWDFEKDHVVRLDGEWAFFYNELFLWQDVNNKRWDVFAEFSKPWSEQIIKGEKLPGMGYATYALELLLPARHDSLAVEVPPVFNSHALWINDKLIATNGKVGRKAAGMEPMWKTQTVGIHSADTLRMIFQIANFQSSRGGSAVSIHLGRAEDLFRNAQISLLSVNLLIIIFTIVGITSLILFAISGRKPLLYFSGLSLAFVLRFIFSDIYPYYSYGLTMTWELAARIEYATIPVILVFSVLFISSIYPLEFRRSVRMSFLIINIVLILASVFIPLVAFSKLLVVIQFVTLAFLIYIIYAISKAVFNRRVGVWATAAGIGISTLVGIYHLYTFLFVIEYNRIIILTGYLLALILSAVSLWYRTSVRLQEENQSILRYSDLFNS